MAMCSRERHLIEAVAACHDDNGTEKARGGDRSVEVSCEATKTTPAEIDFTFDVCCELTAPAVEAVHDRCYEGRKGTDIGREVQTVP